MESGEREREEHRVDGQRRLACDREREEQKDKVAARMQCMWPSLEHSMRNSSSSCNALILWVELEGVW